MKQLLISEIQSNLAGLGIASQSGQTTDLVVRQEFLDAAWSTGRKKIDYEALLLADEQTQTLYMYEKTTETGSGLSFGSVSQNTFQSGKTLYRTVKSVQYGPDGKAYEVSLDLGSIPKTAREVCARYNWQFRTVTNKKKAMHAENTAPASPAVFAGRPPASDDRVVEQAPPRQNPVPVPAPERGERKEPAFAARVGEHSAKPILGALAAWAYGFLAVISALLYWLMSVKLTGWIIGAAVVLAFVLLERSRKRKNRVAGLLLWAAAAVLVFFIMVFASP